ncbi:transporter substrate-binding domain-containing protein [Pseudodesulfovibrio sp. zrk46]|uniref:substrate-binding periplasmic protein n=1 Tax=Pseudodesulfovibrio sp. zrk46 TaxID=2725288 RepID=UPI001448D4E1|nr:transporter substrate-binding domain-containing protein [Pseudodesulfovibrio sp. zrk46]QJB56143.1 transporter substrate-binding domain-containing protein [Pseudodesulfovibrio sp. zrk46]
MIMIRLCAALLLTFFLLSPSVAGAQELFVLTIPSPPYNYEEDGHVAGMATEVVREAFRRMGIEGKFAMIPWKRGLQMVKNGEADAIFRASLTENRTGYMLFPDEPLDVGEVVAFRRKGSEAAVSVDFTDAQGLRTGIGLGFSYGEAFDKNFKAARFAKVDYGITTQQNMKKLMEDRIDLLFVNKVVGWHTARQLGLEDKVEVATDRQGREVVYVTDDNYLAFSKKTVMPELVARFTETLREIKRDGTYDAIFGGK